MLVFNDRNAFRNFPCNLPCLVNGIENFNYNRIASRLPHHNHFVGLPVMPTYNPSGHDSGYGEHPGQLHAFSAQRITHTSPLICIASRRTGRDVS
eukprot:Gb_31810 [translate_table: standard]